MENIKSDSDECVFLDEDKPENSERGNGIIETEGANAITPLENANKSQNKHYKKKHAKVKRSKSQGCKLKTARREMVGVHVPRLDSDGSSTEEDMVKLMETVKKRGRSNRKLVMLDWDRSPFVFSVRSAGVGGEGKRSPQVTRCKNIATIEEEDEKDLLTVPSTAIGRVFVVCCFVVSPC